MATKIKEIEIDMGALKEVIANSSKETAIYVGADSKVASKRGKKIAVYVCVVVVHKDSNAGGRIFKKVVVEPDYGNIRQRLMREVYLAAEVAGEIVETVGKRPFAVHLDINPDPKHKSNVVAKQASGYIMGMLGIEADLKPDAFAASFAADRYAVQLAAKH